MSQLSTKIAPEQLGFELLQTTSTDDANRPTIKRPAVEQSTVAQPVLSPVVTTGKERNNAPRPPKGWKPSVSTPRAEMGQLNYRRWIRFLLLHDAWLTGFEKGVCLTVIRQNFPSGKQRKILWWSLYRIFPAGCGKWGSPSQD